MIVYLLFCRLKSVSDVKTWMTSNRLQMNEDKIEVLLVTAKQIVNLQHLPEFMNINGTCIKFSPSIRNLGVTLDSTLSLHQRVMNVCRVAYLGHIGVCTAALSRSLLLYIFYHMFILCFMFFVIFFYYVSPLCICIVIVTCSI